MTPERWHKVEEIFQSAMDRAPFLRHAYVAEACDGDEVLQRELESLLELSASPTLVDRSVWQTFEDLLGNDCELPIGTQLGPYRIEGVLGAGGMGRVYRARDTRLNRLVALKVSHQEFTERFGQEARSVAALNHPNICTLHDVGPNYLVMELVEGHTLAERIDQGPLPFTEAVGIACQIADALEAAHARGIVHRDLKPANIKLSTEGSVKVLDFGLAKALDEEGSSDSETSIQGTAAYMSPEEAAGKPADRRADIWSFGVVFYEMLTGKHPFAGDTTADILNSVRGEQPKLTDAPAPARPLIERCLTKDPRRRLQAIGEARILLEDGLPDRPNQTLRSPFRFVAAVAVFAIASAAFLAFVHYGESPPDDAIVRFEIPAPPNTSLNTGHFSGLRLSPDGQQVAFTAIDREGTLRIWVRKLDSLQTRFIPGTEDSGRPGPFWSPDSRFLAFVKDGKLKKVDISGGSPVGICDATRYAGGSWNRDGVILFGGPDGIFRVSQAGGTPTVVTSTQEEKEQAHAFPEFLPDGRHFIYSAMNTGSRTVFLGSLDKKGRKILLPGGGIAQYLPPAKRGEPGYVLAMRDGTLMAQRLHTSRFDPLGEAFPIDEHVGSLDPGIGYFAIAANGTLAFRAAPVPPRSHLMWLDRAGKAMENVGPPGAYGELALSRDGTRVAVSQSGESSTTDIWLMDLARGASSRFTTDRANDVAPVWSPRGDRLAFSSDRGRLRTVFGLYAKDSGGVGSDELLLKAGGQQVATDWTPDGELLIFERRAWKSGYDLWVASMNGQQNAGERSSTPYLNEPFDERQGQFSPGEVRPTRWVAYASNESGRYEIYVQSFPPGAPKSMVSNRGGMQPRWRRDGKELFYVSPAGTLMAVDVKVGAKFEHGVPRAVVDLPIGGSHDSQGFRYDVAPDGSRFLIISRPASEDTPSVAINVVLNWSARLRR
jgi:serine/threonine protein kinase